eukprot:TRINITY_DN5133_c0_g1_i1.p1 TRINITY_DN5133_c0_g1~~TRINITY_DN5133_c0_g1_i1.p1  ORF type:complete len:565 (-),score=113.22 TRINITY_DN5133_c0_g1_i1:1816-3510(-)
MSGNAIDNDNDNRGDGVSSARVSVFAKHRVTCEHEISSLPQKLESPFHLGPLDHLMPYIVPIAVVFCYRQHQQTDSEKQHTIIPIERFRRALALLLDNYPHLTGRFAQGSSNEPMIDRLGTGVDLLEASCDARLDSFSSSPTSRLVVTDLPGEGNALFAPFDISFEASFEQPIMTIQHTRFACGGVTLGVRVHHRVCDAEGFFQLVRDLAELYRGIPSSNDNNSSTTIEPQLSRGLPHIRSLMSESGFDKMTPEERQEASKHDSKLFELFVIPQQQQEPSSSESSTATFKLHSDEPTSDSPPKNVGRILRVSASELNALKAQASSPTEGTDSTSGDGWISTFDALTAHLYQRIYIARVEHDKRTRPADSKPATIHGDLLTPINWREASRLNFPPRYFPNASIAISFTLDRETLINAPLSRLAKIVHEAVRSTSREEVLSSLRWIAAQPDKSRIIFKGFHFPGGGFMVSQWYRFGMYVGMEFDDGVPPCLVAPPFTFVSSVDGLAYYLSTEEQLNTLTNNNSLNNNNNAIMSNDCAIDVGLSLEESIWEILDQDPLFLFRKGKRE